MYFKPVLLLMILCISVFIRCKGPAEKKEKQTATSGTVYKDAGDSIYKTAVEFVTPEYNLPLEKISKYKPDSAGKIISKVANHRPGKKYLLSELRADKAVIYKLQLFNGTNVLLNSGSNLVFHPFYGDYAELNGEAYFDIKEKSTVIKVNHKVTVTTNAGTRLNITAYKDSTKDLLVTTTLLSGNAQISGGKRNVYLNKAGSKVIIDIGNNTVMNGSSDTTVVLAWTKNVFNYSQIDNFTLLQRVCRWYDLKLDCPPLGPGYMAFEGDFKEPVQKIITKINSSSPAIQCRIEEKKLIVSKKDQ